MRVAWAAVVTQVRSDARRWWAAWLVLGLLVGLAGGTVMAAVAGARRTDSAFARLLDETNAPDVVVNIQCQPLQLVGTCPSPAEAVAAFRAQPGVVDAAAAVRTFGPITDSGGRVLQPYGDPCYFLAGRLTLLTPLDNGVGRDVLTLRLVEGRAPDEARIDEVVISPLIAREYGIEVGDRVRAYLGYDDCADQDSWTDAEDLTVVGIGFDALEVRAKSGGRYFQSLHTTRAFADTFVDFQFDVFLELDDGVAIRDLTEGPGLPDFTVDTNLQQDIVRVVEAGTDSDATALRMLALVAAIASACVIGPATGRHRRSMARDDAQLAAMGWARGERVLRGAAHAGATWVIAVTVAVIMGLAASTQTPVGGARAIEPAPEVALDPLVFAGGSAILLAAIVLGLVRSRGPRRTRPSGPQRAPVAGLAAEAGLRPAAVLGIRVGVEPGGRDVPVRSSLVALGLGMAAVVGVLVFTASAQRLRDTPGDRGIVWSDAVGVDETSDAIALTEQIRSWPEVEASGYVLFNSYRLKLGQDAQLALVTPFGGGPRDIEPRVLRGRAPRADDELLVNPRMADDLDLELGDLIEVSIQRDGLGPEELNSLIGAPIREFELVGTGAVPVSGGGFTMGTAMTLDGYRSLFPPDYPAAQTPQPDALVIDRRHGIDVERIVRRLADIGINYDPDGVDMDAVLESIVSVDRTSTESVPDLLGLLMVATSAGVLVYGLAIAIGGSRRDLAVVRALGFDRRLILQSTRWVGLMHVAAMLAVALPTGVIAGRAAWTGYTTSIGVAPTDRVPPVELSVLVLVCTAVSVAAASCIGRLQLRRSPGAVLRDE